MNVSVYNHQLCIIDRGVWPFARQSISDWKNEYMPECEGCAVRNECGGFFSSAKLRYSDHISPIAASCELPRSEEHTSELQSLMRISSAVFCLKKKKKNTNTNN